MSGNNENVITSGTATFLNTHLLRYLDITGLNLNSIPVATSEFSGTAMNVDEATAGLNYFLGGSSKTNLEVVIWSGTAAARLASKYRTVIFTLS